MANVASNFTALLLKEIKLMKDYGEVVNFDFERDLLP